MAAPRKVGKEKWSAKNDTWTDRNGAVTEGMGEKGFTRGSAKGLLASDISGLVEVREEFWSSVDLTGNQTSPSRTTRCSSFGAVSI